MLMHWEKDMAVDLCMSITEYMATVKSLKESKNHSLHFPVVVNIFQSNLNPQIKVVLAILLHKI